MHLTKGIGVGLMSEGVGDAVAEGERLVIDHVAAAAVAEMTDSRQ
jgi:hypothetical protein